MSYFEGESERIVSLLKNAIRLSNHTYREIERQLGWRVGTVTRLLRGGLGLKVEHLLAILHVIQFSPGRFFAAAFPARPADAEPGAGEERLARMLEQLHGRPGTTPSAATGHEGRRPAAGQTEIDEMVRISLRRLLATDGRPGGSPLR
jgi:hypothetical protein